MSFSGLITGMGHVNGSEGSPAGALFQDLLREGSEPTSAQCLLYSSEFQICVLNLTEVVFAMSCRNIPT